MEKKISSFLAHISDFGNFFHSNKQKAARKRNVTNMICKNCFIKYIF